MGSLSRRVAEIKALEDANQANLRVLVLDATLPGQRLSLRFDAKDTRRRLGLGTELGVGAAVGDTYAMLGQAPASGQVLPLGTEVKLTRVDPLPDGSGDVEVEMVGVRRLRIEGQPFDENGVAMAKVTYMRFAPEETPPLPRDNESVAPTSPRPIEGGGRAGLGILRRVGRPGEGGARDDADVGRARIARRRGAFYLTLVPIRPRSRGERRSLRTFAGVSLRPPPAAFNPDTPRRAAFRRRF